MERPLKRSCRGDANNTVQAITKCDYLARLEAHDGSVSAIGGVNDDRSSERTTRLVAMTTTGRERIGQDVGQR